MQLRLEPGEVAGRVRGISVALCGPDGVGKSTIASALEDALPGEMLHIHHKPGVLPHPRGDSDRDFSKPYEKAARSSPMSILKALYLFVDWWLGWIFVIWPRVRRGDSVIIQRPWLDLTVDPERYRLGVGAWLLRTLGRFLPDPTITLLLSAPSDVIHARKSELSTSELDVRARRWREEIGSVRRAEVVDVSGDVDDVMSSILAALEGTLREKGRHLSMRNGKWFLPRRPRKAVSASTRLHPPMDRRTRTLAAAAHFGAELGLARLWPAAIPPEELRAAVRPWLSGGTTYAARRLRGGHRWFVLLIDPEGNPELALKIGLSPSDRSAIEGEKETIRIVAPDLEEPLATPELDDAPLGVLAMKPVSWQPRPDVTQLPVPVAASLGALFKNAAPGNSTEGRVHGDMAPWNLLWDGHHWVLVDWEASTASGRPFHDVFHWVVQGHSLLMTPGSEEIIDGLLTFRGNVGAAITAYASAAGIDPAMALTEFGPYLHESEPHSDTSEARLATALSRRRRLAEAWRQAYAPGAT